MFQVSLPEMDKWEASYRNDHTSDRFVLEASASRVIYDAQSGSTRVPVQRQPHLSMTWQADESSAAVVNSPDPVASQVKP